MRVEGFRVWVKDSRGALDVEGVVFQGTILKGNRFLNVGRLVFKRSYLDGLV